MFFVAAALFGSGLGMALEINKGIGEFHEILGLAFIVLVVIHVLLNREWIFKFLAKGRRSRVIVGLVCAALVLLFGLLAPIGERENRKQERYQYRGGQP